MTGLPEITTTARLTEDPVLRYLPSGTPVVRFNVAANERRRNQDGEWEDGRVTFLPVTVWRNQAETVAERLHKGQLVTITGALVQKRWTNDAGENRTGYEVEARDVAESLRGTPAAVNTPISQLDETGDTELGQSSEPTE